MSETPPRVDVTVPIVGAHASASLGLADPRNLNVVADASSIYEYGNLNLVTLIDIVHNEVAIRMLMNDANTARKDCVQLRLQVEELRLERERYVTQRGAFIFTTFANVIGIVMVGLGTSEYVSPQHSQGALVTLALGAVLSLLSSIAPVALPAISRKLSKQGSPRAD